MLSFEERTECLSEKSVNRKGIHHENRLVYVHNAGDHTSGDARANTNLTTVMIAERVAAKLKQRQERKDREVFDACETFSLDDFSLEEE